MSDLYAGLSGNSLSRAYRKIDLLEHALLGLCERVYGPTIGAVEARDRIARIDDMIDSEYPL